MEVMENLGLFIEKRYDWRQHDYGYDSIRGVSWRIIKNMTLTGICGGGKEWIDGNKFWDFVSEQDTFRLDIINWPSFCTSIFNACFSSWDIFNKIIFPVPLENFGAFTELMFSCASLQLTGYYLAILLSFSKSYLKSTLFYLSFLLSFSWTMLSPSSLISISGTVAFIWLNFSIKTSLLKRSTLCPGTEHIFVVGIWGATWGRSEAFIISQTG